jgi:hypothetical protein
MHLQIGANTGGIEQAAALSDGARIKAGGCHRIGQAALRIGSSNLEADGIKKAERPGAAEIRHVEPRRLLGPDAHHSNIAWRHNVLHPQAGDSTKTCNNARSAVEIPALRHAIEM